MKDKSTEAYEMREHWIWLKLTFELQKLFSLNDFH